MSTPMDPIADEFDTSEFTEIERSDTVVRIGLTVLFVLLNGVINSVLGLTIAFQLLWTLITKLPPSPEVRSLANRLVSFKYRIERYMTYNESLVPFPFSDFPAEVEPCAFDPSARDRSDLGVPEGWMQRERRPADRDDGVEESR